MRPGVGRASKPLRLAFSDMGRSFQPDGNPVLHALRARRAVALVDASEADLLVYSVFGSAHRSFVGTKVHWTGENARPAWDEADFFIGFDHIDDPRYLRAPSYVLNAVRDRMSGFALDPPVPWNDRAFCNFIYSKRGTTARQGLFERVNGYRTVTSPGAFLRNTEAPELADRRDQAWRHSKLQYLRRFRFTIACENSSYPGYTTEKLTDALQAGTIPIYWGDPRVADTVDERSFINCHAYRDLGEVVDVVRAVDNDPVLAASYLDVADPLRVPAAAIEEQLIDFLDEAATAATQRLWRRRDQQARARRLAAVAD